MDSSSTGTRPANIVFLSGEAQPLTIPGTDRRYWIVDADKAVTLGVPSGDAWDATLGRWQDWLNSRVKVVNETPEPAPHPSRSAPLCVDCRHMVAISGNGKSFQMCNHPTAPRSHVDGRPERLCTSARDQGKECGPEAQLFHGFDGSPVEFAKAWLDLRLPLPVVPCTAEQLYRAFRCWCDRIGARWPPAQAPFSAAISKADLGLSYQVEDIGSDGLSNARLARVWSLKPQAHGDIDRAACLKKFEKALTRWAQGRP